MELSTEEVKLITKHREYKEKKSIYNKDKHSNLTEEEHQIRKDKMKIYHLNNLDKAKQYKQDNKEHIKEYMREYRKTPSYKKSYCITNWRKNGVICDNNDFSSLYDKYLNCKNCEECGVELQTGNAVKNKRCLDHDHKTGLFRNIICNSCNVIRGNNDRNI